MDESGREVVDTVQAEVDGEAKADEDLVGKHDERLDDVEAVASER